MDAIRNKIQKIEQGMGRGVRSNNDYCGVIIMGDPLIQILYSPKSKDFFSNATKKQFEVSNILAQDLKGKSIDEIFNKTYDKYRKFYKLICRKYKRTGFCTGI